MRFPFKLMGSSSCFSGRLGEERGQQRLTLLAPAVGAFVVTALSLADGQGEGYFFLAPLAVEFIVGHGGPSFLLRGRVSRGPASRPPNEIYSPTAASERRRRRRQMTPIRGDLLGARVDLLGIALGAFMAVVSVAAETSAQAVSDGRF